MLRAHTLVENAVYLLLWEAFGDWFLTEGYDIDELSVMSGKLSNSCLSVNNYRDGEDPEVVQNACKEAQDVMEMIEPEVQDFITARPTPTTTL